MAGRAMKVAVLEGDFVALCNLGLPFSVSYQLQEKGLKLPDALWTIKSSASGFSVSLFWPSSASENMKKKKRRRKRAKAKKSVNSKISDQANQDISCKESMEKPASEIFDIPTPTRAHHHLELTNVVPTQDALPSQRSGSSKSIPSLAPTDFAPSTSKSENGVDLTACSNVNFELRDGQAGVCLKIQATCLIGHLWLAGGRNVHNYLHASYVGSLLTILYDRAILPVAVIVAQRRKLMKIL